MIQVPISVKLRRFCRDNPRGCPWFLIKNLNHQRGKNYIWPSSDQNL